MNLKSQKEFARKAFYAGIGAPVVAGRMAKDYAEKLAARGNKMSESAQKRFEEYSKEGEKVTKQLRDTDMVEEIQSRVDFDKVQDRVEKMRDQLEGALDSWRESFAPAAKPVAVKKAETKKAPVARKAPASKPAAKKPATKAASKPAAKKAPAKTTAKKTTPTTRKAPAKTTAAKTTAKKTTATARKSTAAKK